MEAKDDNVTNLTISTLADSGFRKCAGGLGFIIKVRSLEGLEHGVIAWGRIGWPL